MKTLLIPINGGPSIELDKELTLVGREAACDVRLEHNTVSKLHCLLFRNDGLLLLRDLDSTNGCRINGQRVKRGALLHNDVLSFAGLEFRVYLQETDEDDSPPLPLPERSDATEVIELAELRKIRDSRPPAAAESAAASSSAKVKNSELAAKISYRAEISLSDLPPIPLD